MVLLGYTVQGQPGVQNNLNKRGKERRSASNEVHPSPVSCSQAGDLAVVPPCCEAMGVVQRLVQGHTLSQETGRWPWTIRVGGKIFLGNFSTFQV